MCTFNDPRMRLQEHISTEGHRPAISQGADCGCILSRAVAKLAFEKGRKLFHQGDRVRGAYSLTSGLVAIERVDEDGEFVILRLLRPGTLFPCADLFADGQHGTAARALTDAEVCFIPLERLEAAMAEPAVRTALMRASSEEARQHENTIFRLCANDLAERILDILREFAMEQDVAPDGTQSIKLPLQWRDIAAMVGTSPEVLSRTLRRLVEERRLTFSGRYVTLAPETVAPGRRAV